MRHELDAKTHSGLSLALHRLLGPELPQGEETRVFFVEQILRQMWRIL